MTEPARVERPVDWHCHSYWSDGGGTVGELAAQAEKCGVTLGIADHGFVDNTRLRTREQLEAYLADLAQHRVLRGIEISIGETGPHGAAERQVKAGQLPLEGIDAAEPPEGLLDRFDYVIASLHGVCVPEGMVYSARYLNWRAGLYGSYRPSVVRYARRAYFDALLAALEETIERWPVTILGHFCVLPELAAASGEYQPDDDPEPDAEAGEWVDAVMGLCVRRGVAVELNSKSRVPHRSVARRALELGARFSLGSDAHTLANAGNLSYGLKLVRELGIPPDRILAARDVVRSCHDSD